MLARCPSVDGTDMSTDSLIVGDRMFGATTRLMAALHVERITETELDKAAPDMVPVFETALEAAHAQTTVAWRECVDALGAWTATRLGLTPNVLVTGRP